MKNTIKTNKMIDDEKSKLKILFNTAYAVAKKGKLNRHSTSGCNNIPSCTTFVNSIANLLREDICKEILNCKCLSITSDGSTDAAVIEQEIVYLR